MNKPLFYDPKSRYNNINDKKIIFLTPNQLTDLDIGFPVETTFHPEEYNQQFPIMLDTLKEMVRETTLGERNGSEIAIPIEGSNCRAFICISINGKLCKLQSEEWCVTDNLHGMPIQTQIKVFQRLISEGQITLEDLAAEDIDNSVYKKLVVNELSGALICKEKIEKLDNLWEEQKKDNELSKKLQKVINNM